jgi:nitrate reductase alpha subunit
MADLDDALVRAGRYLRRGVVSADLRTLEKTGGREADGFYQDRWSYDKVVRSTHGVNCTGSCSWKVYVKDGIITWEAQQTDYPSAGPDRPDYQPRGCPRGRRSPGTPTRFWCTWWGEVTERDPEPRPSGTGPSPSRRCCYATLA